MSEPDEFSLRFGRAFGKVVVHVDGPLVADTADELRVRLIDVIDGQGNRQVVLDLRGLTDLDAAGVAVLVDALKRMQRTGGELVLSSPSPDVSRSISAAGLDKIFVVTPAWQHPVHGDGRSLSERRRQSWGRSG